MRYISVLSRLVPAGVALLAAALLAACAGNGAGLDANGQPLGSSGAAPPLTADLKSIQDNVFTPICVPCHSGAGAPQGLELDVTHSHALLVGVPSSEDPAVLRVKPDAPDSSYLILKLQGSPGIVGVQMPFGGPPLPQATIDVIRQWISDGAPQPMSAAAAVHFVVVSSMPVDHSRVRGPLRQIVVAFSHEVDASLINYTTLRLESLTADGAQPATDSLSLRLAEGDASAVLVTPGEALGAGTYRLTLRGSGGGALADVDARALGVDYRIEFTVDAAP